jgi:hypothetical protein
MVFAEQNTKWDQQLLSRETSMLDRSGHAAIMKSTLARIQGGGDSDTFAEMERAMKGLMDVSFEGRDKDPVVPVACPNGLMVM